MKRAPDYFANAWRLLSEGRLEKHLNKNTGRTEWAYVTDMGRPRVGRWFGKKKPTPEEYRKVWEQASMFKHMH